MGIVGGVLPIPSLIGLVVLWLWFPEKTALMWRFGLVFIVSSAAFAFYDALLQIINPNSLLGKLRGRATAQDQ